MVRLQHSLDHEEVNADLWLHAIKLDILCLNMAWKLQN
jgi:hypothetical protein